MRWSCRHWGTDSMLLDHVVFFVDDLDDAVTRFSALGFTVTLGGINGPTHNALIAFENETYIELIALRSVGTRRLFKLLRRLGLLRLRGLFKKDLNTRLFRWFSRPQGFTDICFRAPSLEAVEENCSENGHALTSIVPFNRHRPDGVTVSWRLMGSVELSQPFFIEDETPLTDRIPDGAAREHANGAVGITELVTRAPLNFSPDNATTAVNRIHRRGRFGVGIKTTGAAKRLSVGSVYTADVWLTK